MVAKITFFPVGNGDMTLIETEDNKRVLIDCRIRAGADYPDVVSMLTERLLTDDKGRHYVDVFVCTHPHDDHCGGIQEHFYLGKPEDYADKSKKIFINEIWASPIVFKRANQTDHKLTDDARALHAEIRRRIRLYQDKQYIQEIGNQVLILTQDEEGNLDSTQRILCKRDSEISRINNQSTSGFRARVLGPAPKSDIEEQEVSLGANESSVIMNYQITGDGRSIHFLTGGDAKVVCWDVLWEHLEADGHTCWLEYDLLQAPHHCSWRSLSHDSWKDKKAANETAEVSEPAWNALSQAKDGAFIVSSSKSIHDDDKDPPSFAAMKEYRKILSSDKANFVCVADHQKDGEETPLEFWITSDGLTRSSPKKLSLSGTGKNSVNLSDDGRGYA